MSFRSQHHIRPNIFTPPPQNVLKRILQNICIYNINIKPRRYSMVIGVKNVLKLTVAIGKTHFFFFNGLTYKKVPVPLTKKNFIKGKKMMKKI